MYFNMKNYLKNTHNYTAKHKMEELSAPFIATFSIFVLNHRVQM